MIGMASSLATFLGFPMGAQGQGDRAMPDEFCTQYYGTSERVAYVQAIAEKGLLRTGRPKPLKPRSLISVIRRPDRFHLKHGHSPDGIRFAKQAGDIIAGLGLPLFCGTVANQFMLESEVRDLARRFKSNIVREQRRIGTPPWWLEMDEGSPAWHANILFPLGGPNPLKVVERLARSASFPGDTLEIHAESAASFVGYHAKYRASCASFVPGVKMAKRIKGSHRNGEGGGNWVSVADDLLAFMREGGLAVVPRIYASRALPKQQPVEPVMVEQEQQQQQQQPVAAPVEVEEQRPAVETVVVEPIAAVIEQPVVVVVVVVEPVQLGLFDAPAVNVFSLVEAQRRKAGISQRKFAGDVFGIGQSGYANIIRGHDKPSQWLINRAVEFIGGIAA